MTRYITTIVRYLSLRLWPCLLWTLFIVSACLMPPSGLPSAPVMPGFDKFAHVVLFGVWSFLFAGYTRSNVAVVLLTGFALGLGIEFLQEASGTGRSFEWWDVVADLTGVLLGYLVRVHIMPAFLPDTKIAND